MISWVKSIKGFQGFKLLSNFPFFHFCCQWLFFNSAFALLVGIPVGIASSAIPLNICAITAGFKTI